MSAFTTVNILDIMNDIGEEGTREYLSDFTCPKNKEIENFLKKNAIEFAKKKMSVTHFVLNELGEIVAFFTLTHKALEIEDKNMSSTMKKKVMRYAQPDRTTNSYLVSAFLVAQFGKNYSTLEGSTIGGDCLMETAMEILSTVQYEIGGGIIYLECENNPKLLSFYQNENNNFRPFGERYSPAEGITYIQLLRFF